EEKSWKPKQELEIAVDLGRYEDEAWRVRKDGTIFWANVIITALRDDKGRLIGFSKITRDLSDRIKNERLRLEKAKEEEFHGLADSLPIMIWAADREGIIQ